MYHIYKITNLLNNKLFIGYYRGEITTIDKIKVSQSNLRKDFFTIGKQNFKLDILYSFSDEQLKETKLKYKEILSKDFFVQNTNTYNNNIYDLTTVKDSNGKSIRISIKDPRYLNGELKSVAKGTVNVKDKNNNIFQVSIDDPRYISGELVHMNKGIKNEKVIGTFIAKDINGNHFRINKQDPRYLSGELIGTTTKDESKKKKPIIKEKQPRKIVTEKSNYKNSQIRVQSEKKKQKYPEFNYVMTTKNKKIFVENFCKHGDLSIDNDYFKFIYTHQNNNHILYCDKCKQEYLNSIQLTNGEIESSRVLLKQLYKKGPSSIKEYFVFKYHQILYKSINDNCIEKELQWNEK